jgi:hypothetical protein
MSGGQSCFQLFQQAAERNFYSKNNLHITLLKVVNNLMMLYIGMALCVVSILNY